MTDGVPLADGILRILAPNPSALTGTGTNTYLLGTRDIAVIDPGPMIAAHLDAILAAVPPGARITAILITHSHLDHSALAPALAAQTGAPVYAFGDAQAGRNPAMARFAGLGGGEGLDTGFVPDVTLADGSEVGGDGWRLRAIHTPGHIGNHLCLQSGDLVFSGDQVMGWATSIVSPPDGDMGAYMASLDRLARVGAQRMLPGHGAPIEAPAARIAALAAHRRGREASILAALETGPMTPATLTAVIYHDTPPALHPAAERNVLAHLLDLEARNLVTTDTALSAAAAFRLW